MMAKPKSRGKKSGSEDIPVSSLPTHRGEGFVSVYSNNANVSAGFYDLSIVFSEIGLGPDQKPSVEERCRVVMNPAHAKALAFALAVNLKRWESQFGAISFPPGMIKGLQEAGKALSKEIATSEPS